ncbi:hypothetical protein VPH35_070456 [Triticum aestivum]
MVTLKSTHAAAALVVLVVALALTPTLAEVSACPEGDDCVEVLGSGELHEPKIMKHCCENLSEDSMSCLCELRDKFAKRFPVMFFDAVCPTSCGTSITHESG